MKNLVFVYGSLKNGLWNHSVLGDSPFVGEAVTIDRFLMTTVGFPYMIPKNLLTEDHYDESYLKNVKGEVYEVNENTQKSLDILEGVAHDHYKQEEITVFINGEIKTVLAYIPCDPNVQYYRIVDTNKDDIYDF